MFKLLTIVGITTYLICVLLLLTKQNFRKSNAIMIFTILFILSTSLLFSLVEGLYLTKINTNNIVLLIILIIINILSILVKTLPTFNAIKNSPINKDNGVMIIAKMLPCEFINVIGFILMIFMKG